MKISKLLVLTALWLGIASSAKAEVPEGVWSIPEPKGLEFTEPVFDDSEARLYLYNPTAKMFFASGNDWNTRASIASFAYEIWFMQSYEEDILAEDESNADHLFVAPEGSYEFWDNCAHPDRVLGDKNMFTDDGGSTWVDRASQANYTWTVTKVGDSYRIQNIALVFDKPEYEGKYIGWKGNYSDTRLYMLAEGEGAIDWKFVTHESYDAFVADEEAYNAYKEGFELYNLAADLRKLLVEGEEIGASIADQLAVYNNTASTKAELTAAITATQEAIDKRKKELIEGDYANATVEKPVVVSDKFLVNYDFKGDNLTKGWSGDAFGSYGPKENAEHYNKNYNTYQDVNGGMLPGIYAVGVKAFYRAGNAQPAWDNYKEGNAKSKYAKLYAKVGGVEREAAIVSPCIAMLTEYSGRGGTSTCVDKDEEGNETTYIIPNNMEAAEYYMHDLGLYDNKVLIAVNAETDTLRLGVRKTSTIDGDWSIFDDFSLTYFGAGADACQLYLAEAMKNFGEVTLEEGTLFTESYLTAYQSLLTTTPSASNLDEVNQYLNGIDAAYNNLQKNIDLWADWLAAVERGNKYVVDDKYAELPAILDLADYCDELSDEGYKAIEEAHALTNEELEAEIAMVNKMIQDVIDQSKADYYEGKDMTEYITNPGFDEDKDIDFGGAQGWTIDRIDGGNVVRGPLGQGNKELMEGALGYMNYCFESWHCHKWDIWQEIKDLPKGMYELQVQGYVRCEVGGYNRGDEIEPDYPSPVYLYMNNAMSQFPSVYSQIPAEFDGGHEFTTVESWTTETVNDNLYPNSMGGAAQCFGWGMYMTQAYGLIAKDGDVFRIGVKMDKDQDWWCIFDSFKLIYHDPTPELVKPILEEELAKLDLSAPMGKDIYEKAAAVKTAAQDALAGTDGVAMFNALSDIYDLSAAIIESTSLFSELQKANEAMYEVAYSSENAAAKTEAEALYATINNGIENHTITDAEAKEYMEQIESMYTPLNLPAGMELASDSNPVECTKVIKSASFETEDMSNTSEGWTNPGNLGNDDTQKGALAMEFWQIKFDMYQTIIGLPEGTYMVTADAWCRNGDNSENFEAWKADPAATMAMIYAVDGDSAVYSAPVANMMKAGDALFESTGYEGETEFTTKDGEGNDVTYYLPSSLVSGKGLLEMNPGVYTNTLIAKVKADGKLTVGIKKAEEKTNSWVVVDDFKLYYLGKESSQTPSPDLTGIDDVNNQTTLKVEYFTLDGRKATYAQKGIMIQKVTFANGATMVKKIRK